MNQVNRSFERLFQLEVAWFTHLEFGEFVKLAWKLEDTGLASFILGVPS